MERQRNSGEHPYHLHLVPADEQERAQEESHDERVIREGIEAALAEDRNIDDRTARYIASQLHEGQGSALYALASSGAIRDEIHDELTRDYAELPEQVQGWINWLGVYCMDRPDAGPVDGWAARAAEQDRAELAERISAAGIRTLGSVATVHEVMASGADVSMDDQETDTFSWSDAARWQPEVASFGGVGVAEIADRETVSRLANRVVEHGQAFAVWADYLGTEDMDYVERTFEEAYRGTWPSMVAYVENYLEDTVGYSFFESIPEELQPYVGIDSEAMARDWEMGMYVVEVEGRVMVFETRVG